MQLRRRLQIKPESISDFYRASTEKFLEGKALLAAGHSGGGVYLLGYAAEMSLKWAAFLFDGALPADQVFPKLIAAKSWAANNGIGAAPEGYHSLRFWCAYLQSRRLAAGRKLSVNVDGALAHHVDRVYFTWWVEMRYRPDSATSRDAERAIQSVTWLMQHRLVLARS